MYFLLTVTFYVTFSQDRMTTSYSFHWKSGSKVAINVKQRNDYGRRGVINSCFDF